MDWKEWFEQETGKQTKQEEWSEETVELEKDELSPELIPTDCLDRLPETLTVSFYGYGVEDVVYVMPLKDSSQLLYGLLHGPKLVSSIVVECDRND
ncbi:hypothetical protein [Vagococcus bubulae]|uniref:Uncharacterized protein n=1 Tax=Vagococcus bubulae TaxID=1977868 RepID=A0A429ZFJ8_9ENTE|nr:hypothetical protein [Vagococcus bubulae]RST92445.1 hypothetical protein CBF36_08740 [Vagococcus bubulae]